MTQAISTPDRANIQSWRARGILLALTSLLVAPLSAGLAVWADILIRMGQWPVLPGAVAVIGGMFVAFYALSLPVLPGPTAHSWRAVLASVIFTIGAAIPAVVTGIELGFNQSTIFQRVTLVIAAMLVGLSAKRWQALSPLSSLPPSWLRVLDAIRQGVLMLIVGWAALLYVSAPALVITTR